MFAQMGQFYFGSVGQYYIGANTNPAVEVAQALLQSLSSARM
jgi:hypothetical protein